MPRTSVLLSSTQDIPSLHPNYPCLSTGLLPDYETETVHNGDFKVSSANCVVPPKAGGS